MHSDTVVHLPCIRATPSHCHVHFPSSILNTNHIAYVFCVGPRRRSPLARPGADGSLTGEMVRYWSAQPSSRLMQVIASQNPDLPVERGDWLIATAVDDGR